LMIADAQHFADLGQGQAQCLGRAHEPQPGDRVLVVGAVPAGGAVRGREEPGVLVEPDGSHRYCRSGGELADAHPPRLAMTDRAPSIRMEGWRSPGLVSTTGWYIGGTGLPCCHAGSEPELPISNGDARAGHLVLR